MRNAQKGDLKVMVVTLAGALESPEWQFDALYKMRVAWPAPWYVVGKWDEERLLVVPGFQGMFVMRRIGLVLPSVILCTSIAVFPGKFLKRQVVFP